MKKILISLTTLILIMTAIWLLKTQSHRQPSSTLAQDAGAQTVEIKSWPLDGETKKQIKRIVLKSWDWHFNSQILFINFENLIFKKKNENSGFCEAYANITAVLESPNVSYNGDHPEILITLPCPNAQSVNHSGQINLEFNFNFLNDLGELEKIKKITNDPGATIRIQNWDAKIPQRWRLKQLVFMPVSKDASATIDLIKYEFIAVLGYSIEFELLPQKQ